MGASKWVPELFPQFHPVPCKERSICIIFTDFVNFDFGVFCEIFGNLRIGVLGPSVAVQSTTLLARKEHLRALKNTGGHYITCVVTRI